MKLSVRHAIPLVPDVIDLDSQGFEIGLPPLDSLGGGEPHGAQYTGIKALMLAVLEDGVRNYLAPGGRLRAEAESWIASPPRGSPFAFSTVCEVLGLEPSAVRVALRRLREKNQSARRVLGRTRPNVRRPARLLAR